LVECSDLDHPFDIDLQIQPSSIDVRLSNEFFKYKDKITFIDTQINQENFITYFTLKENEPLILMPNELIYGQTLEIINLNDKLCARVELRSSLARFGLITHYATYMNPGYSGSIPLQIKNISNKPLVIRPYIRICTVIFEELKEPCITPYNKRENAKYLIEKKISPSKLYLDPDIHEKIISKEEIKKYIQKFNKNDKLLQHLDLNERIIKKYSIEIYSEAFYLANCKDKNEIDLDYIEQASQNVKKIYEYVYNIKKD